MKYYNLIFDEFPPVIGKSIIIPKNFLFFRGHSIKENVLSETPKFFGNEEVAISYSLNKKLSCFTNTKEIKLLDLRYLKLFLQPILSNRSNNNYDEIIARTMMAFGICSYKKQIELVKHFYSEYKNIENSMKNFEKEINNKKIMGINPIEPQGFRIAETNNDAYVFLFLQKLLGEYCDGIISPQLSSPFHIEKNNKTMTSEIILFNPKKAGLVLIKDKIIKQDFDIKKLLEVKNDYKPFCDKEFFIQF